MDILYCTTFLHYGAGRALLELAKEATLRGNRCKIIATGKFEDFESEPFLIEEAKRHGIDVILFDDLYTREFKPSVLRSFLTEHHFDLIHSHAAIPGFAASLHTTTPQISTVHGWSQQKPDWMKKKDIAFLNTLPAVHAVSHQVKEFLIQEGLNPKIIHVIYNGVDFTKLDDVIPLPKLNQFRIGTVSHLTERKGIHYLIEAISMLPQEIEVIIAGTGPQEAELKNQARAFPNIKFIGYEPNPYPLMKSFDLFVLPSLSEGLPVALVEAAYLEIPILTTNAQGNHEIAKFTHSMIVPPSNAKALAEAILKFYHFPIRPQGKAWVKQHFNKTSCFDQMFKLYDKILKN